MRFDFIDTYSRLDSPVHRASAAAKATLAVALVVGVVVVPLTAPAFHATVAVLVVLLAALSTIPPRFLVGRLLLLEPFVAGLAVLALFQPEGATIALGIIVKSSLCLATMILLSNTTPFARLLGLLHRVGAPPLLVTVLALMVRYLFVLVDEAQRMHRARLSRTFVPSRRRAWATSASLIGQLFVRSSERAERVYAAMCARGWQ